MKEKEIVNHGVLDLRRETDFAGGTLPFEILNETAEWEQDVPTQEYQYGPGGDKMNCVTQSLHNDFETLLNYRIRTGKLAVEHLKFLQDNGYFDANGKINFSDKFNSITNGTTPAGNYGVVVADDARKVGLIPQSMLPENIGDPWDKYYDPKQITPAMYAMGKKFLQHFSIAYEWVDMWIDKAALLKQLQQCPIQFYIPGHAIAGIGATLTTGKYFDTYNPFVKNIDRNGFTNGLKVVLTPIINPVKGENMVFFKIKGQPAIYEFVNGAFRGYDDPVSYQKDVNGKQVTIIELDEVEFKKLPQLFPI